MRNTGKDNLIALENLETLCKEKEIQVNEQKEYLELKMKSFNKKRTETTIPIFNIGSPYKKFNPPRLLVKINEVIKKKKMMISVLLSLFDKNNTGLIYSNHFVEGMKSYGKKVKSKHVDEVFKNGGKNVKFIEARMLEKLFEDYRYDVPYVSSESDGEDRKKLMSGQASPFRSGSPLRQGSFRQESPRKTNNPASISPEPKKEVPVVKPVPVPVTVPIPKENLEKKRVPYKKVPDVFVPTINFTEISHVFEYIKSKMIEARLLKSKMVTSLFGHDFDPDEMLDVGEINKYLFESSLGISDLCEDKKFARFLIEPDASSIKESELLDLKGCIRGISRKIIKVVPDWELPPEVIEIYDEVQENDYKPVDNAGEGIIEEKNEKNSEIAEEKTIDEGGVFEGTRGSNIKSEIIEDIENIDPSIDIKIEEKTIENDSVLGNTKTIEEVYRENEFIDESYKENDEIINDEVEEVEEKSENKFFDHPEIQNSPKNPIKVQESLDINLSASQNYIEDFVNSSHSSKSQNKDAISEHYSYEEENFEASLSPKNHEKSSTISNKNAFSESNTIEEAIHEENKNEIELDFVDYGISIEQQ